MNLLSLQSVSRMLSNCWNIKVIFSNGEIRTTKDCIILPYNKNIPDLVVLGYLGHEIGHILYTNFDIVDKIVKSQIENKKLLFNILNTFEDVRIERLIEQQYKGFVNIFYNLDQYYIQTQHNINRSKISQLLDLLYLIPRNYDYSRYDEEIVDLVKRYFSGFIKKLDNTKNTKDVLNLAENVYNLLYELFVIEKDDQLERYNNTTTRYSQSNEMWSGFNDNAGSQTSSIKGFNITSYGGVAHGKEKPNLRTSIRQEIDSINSETYKVYKESVRDIIKKKIEDFQTASNSCYTIHPIIELVDVQTEFTVAEGSSIEYENIKKTIQTEIKVIQNRLQNYLTDQKYYRWYSGSLRGRKVDRKRLARISVGELKIFCKKKYSDANDVCFTLLIDESGSMYGPKLYEAKKTLIMFGEMLNTLELPFEIIGFSSFDLTNEQKKYIRKYFKYDEKSYNRCHNLRHNIFKRFDDNFNFVKYRLVNLRSSNANYDQDTLKDYIWPKLKERNNKRKVIIVISDAQPCGGPEARDKLRQIISEINNSGDTSIVGVGVQTEYVKDFYPKYIEIQRAEDLSLSIAKLLEDLIFDKKKVYV